MAAVPQDVQVMAEEGQGPAPPRQFGSLELEGQPSGLSAGERACLILPVLPFCLRRAAGRLLDMQDRTGAACFCSGCVRKSCIHSSPTPSLWHARNETRLATDTVLQCCLGW